MKIKQNFLTAARLMGFSAPVMANILENLSSNPMAQVTSVNQLRDVSPTASAFEA